MSKTVNVTMRVEPGLKQEADKAALELGVTLSSVYRQALKRLIVQAGKERVERVREREYMAAVEEQARMLSEARKPGGGFDLVQPMNREQRRKAAKSKR